MNDKLFKRYVINYFGNLPEILKKMDIDVRMNGLFFCPMHDNFNTPAAKLFKDPNGWCFYCFSENRIFGTYDIYKDIFNYDMDKVFDQLWNSLSEAKRSEIETLFGEYNINTPVEDLDLYNAFKTGQISYNDLIDKLGEIK